ncbi:MAG: DoxX family protein [bacterium]|nr:DoxX family protein [bacterium]
MAKAGKSTFAHLYCCTVSILERFTYPLVDLWARLLVGHVFWRSGVIAIKDWEANLWLYEFEFNVPLIPPEIAAYASTFFEILCPVLLALGLGTRIGAFILLTMTVVIELTYTSAEIHYFWAVVLAFLVVKGAGPLSIDYWVKKRWCRSP